MYDIKTIKYKIKTDKRFRMSLIKKSLLSFLLLSLIFYISYNYSKIADQIDKYIKSTLIKNVLKNEFIINKISYEILELCKQEKIKKLLRELLINEILRNKELKLDLDKVVKREIISYLKSEDCNKDLKNLLINEVLRSDNLRLELYSVIKEFVTLKEINFLEDKFEDVLVGVLNIPAIHVHVSKKIEAEVHNILRDEKMITMVINILNENMK